MNGYRTVSALAACTMAILAIGCAPKAPPVPDTRAADETAVRAEDEAWAKRAESGQVDQFLMAYANDAVVLAPNAPMASDEASRRKMMTDMFATPGFALTWQPSKVEVARGGDIAYSLGTYQLTVNDPSGKPINDRGKYATVWRKQADGSWKAIVDMFNTDLPAEPPKPAEGTAPPKSEEPGKK